MSSYMDFPGFVSSFAPRNFPEKVIVTYPSYFENLEALIERTPAEVLQAYFVSQAALQLAPFLGLNTELWGTVSEFNQVLNGIKKGTPIDREKWCLARVQEGLGFMAGRFFVNEVFGELCGYIGI
jgi:endothelin-converting enzyme